MHKYSCNWQFRTARKGVYFEIDMYLRDALAVFAVASVCHMACYLATNPDATQPHWTVSGKIASKGFVYGFNFACTANVSDRYAYASLISSCIVSQVFDEPALCLSVGLTNGPLVLQLMWANARGAWQLSSTQGAACENR